MRNRGGVGQRRSPHPDRSLHSRSTLPLQGRVKPSLRPQWAPRCPRRLRGRVISASSWPGLSRPSTSWQIEKKGVDARVEPGHDESVTRLKSRRSSIAAEVCASSPEASSPEAPSPSQVACGRGHSTRGRSDSSKTHRVLVSPRPRRTKSRPASSGPRSWLRHNRASTTGSRACARPRAADSDIPSPACRRR